jgi:hypothetical protein
MELVRDTGAGSLNGFIPGAGLNYDASTASQGIDAIEEGHRRDARRAVPGDADVDCFEPVHLAQG